MALASLCACVSVPKEAVELSTLTGDRLAALQASHEAFLHEYFQASRSQIEDFLTYRWTPTFLATFVRDAKIMDLLEAPNAVSDADLARLNDELTRAGLGANRDQVVRAVQRAFGDAARGKTMLQFAQAAVDQIEAQRQSLLGPLADLESQALRTLRAEYADVTAMQSSVTAYLHAANKESIAEDQLLARLNLLQARDQALDGAIALNQQIVRATQTGQSAEAVIQTITTLLNKGGDKQ